MTRLLSLRKASIAAALLLALAVFMDFVYAPQDDLQGPVQRIFYFHVSSAIAAYFCFALVLAGGVLYLWRGSERADRIARAAAPVGLVFTSVVFGMGTVWAKAIWGWDPTKPWDARLTSTAVLWVVYAGYILVRRFAAPGRPAARLSAIVGIVGFVDVPVVHFSVQWWRTLHPGPIIEAPGGPALPAAMLQAFMVTMVAVLFLGGTLISARYRIEVLRERREADQDRQELQGAAQLPVGGTAG
jgi:heme exporter protein C